MKPEKLQQTGDKTRIRAGLPPDPEKKRGQRGARRRFPGPGKSLPGVSRERSSKMNRRPSRTTSRMA